MMKKKLNVDLFSGIHNYHKGYGVHASFVKASRDKCSTRECVWTGSWPKGRIATNEISASQSFVRSMFVSHF
jgi:hypothetical protein